MVRIWKPILGYEDEYIISDYGEIISISKYDSRGHLRKAKVKKFTKNKYGYLVVGLHKNGKEKKFLVHRLVAENFIDNPQKYEEVNHIDENKTNNSVANLEWCSRKYNVNYGNCQLNRIKSRYGGIKNA